MYEVHDVTVRVPAYCCEGRLGLPAACVGVQWDSSELTMPQSASRHLETRWEAYLAEARTDHRTLFNGPVTRLIRVEGTKACATGCAWRRGDRLILHLGPAEYKSFLVTCLRDRAWFDAHAPQCRVLALGNSALVTSGDLGLLGVRSKHVSAYAGRAHLLGGVLDLLGRGRLTADAEGVIAHLQAELAEEAGVAAADLQERGEWPRFLGIAEDQALAQPEAIWQWESRIGLEAIARRLDPKEHGGWSILQRGQMNEGLWRQMTPVARYTWRIWSESSNH